MGPPLHILLLLAAELAGTSSASSEAPVQERVDPILYEVVVTGSRNERRLLDSPVATEVITREEILASGSENAAQVLDKAPGIQVNESFRGAGAGIQLQGLDTQHVLILVDGQRVIGRKDGVVDLSRFKAERIERIEIVKGAASALYGADAVGGVVNIITRKPSEALDGSLHARYGSRNRLDLSADLGGRLDKWSGSINGGFHRGDAYQLEEASAATSGSLFNEGNVEARLDYQASEDVLLSARADFLGRGTDGIDTSPQGGVFDRINRTQTFSGVLGSDINASGTRLRFTGHFSMFNDDFLLDQRQSNEFTQSKTLERLGQLTAQVDRTVFSDHLVSAGLEGLVEQLESERLDEGSGDRARLSLFLQDEWTLNEEPWLVLVPGFRFDADSQFGTHPTPRISARADVSEHLIFRASLATAFRAPSFRELLLVFDNFSAGYRIAGNPELEPETSRNINFGAEVRPYKWLWATANFYRNDIDNLIQLESQGEIATITHFEYVNVAQAVTQGVESMLRVVPFEVLTVELGYTFLHAKDVALNRTLEGRADHRITYKLLFDHRPWGTQAWFRGTWVSERPFYDEAALDGTIGDAVAAPYTTFDLRAQQDIGDHFQVFAGIDNVLDTGDPRFNPIPPRSFHGGINARL